MKDFIAKLSKGSRWAIGVVLAMIMMNLAQIPTDMALLLSMVFMVTFLGFVFMCLKIKAPPTQKDLERQRKMQEAEEARLKMEEIKRRAEEEHAAEIARKAEWERTHGRISTKLAGVTFKNDDGSSRQDILKEFAVSGDEHDVELEVYDYNGEEAIRVKWEGYCCGNIPRKNVKEILAVEDKIDIIRMDVETFTPSDRDDDFDDSGRTISGSKIKLYRADLTIVYSKE